ncbi:hypothetical protein ACIPSE_30055 [Streptomyces sp. NPDC090106]|uniref:hypothetical protein n=1 Tax=Streptomyces sp. NPDC090106 TaxID=3365946 RepID=UPI0038301BD8
MRTGTATVVAVCALALAACAPGNGAAGPAGGTAPSVTASSTPPSTSASPAPSQVTGTGQRLVTLEISGGFAGVAQRVVLRDDGTVQAEDDGEKAEHRTREAEFGELRTLLDNPALDEVPDLTVDEGARDLFRYEIRLGDRTILTDRSSEHPALDRLIDALSEYLPT